MSNPVNHLRRTNSAGADSSPDLSVRRYQTHVMTAQAQHQKIPDDAKVESRQRASSFADLMKSEPKDYWIRPSPRNRTESVGTRSSSRNSSLHGSPKFCYQKEYQNDYFASKSTHHHSSPGLPPPPVKLRKRHSKGHSSKRRARKLSFDCDICGENVKLGRRREWQKHVMSDLCPYVCTSRECDRTASFPSLKEYLLHEIEAHETVPSKRSLARTAKRKREESIVCIFCGERTEAGNGNNSRGRHVGRHMEEIAFIIVPKAYEEWDFYTDSSASKSISWKQTKGNLPRDWPRSREATPNDAQKHCILAGCSLTDWDPEEEPIVLLGSVFDANSLGKWIYDWTVFRHGAEKHQAVLARDLWLNLISMARKMKKIKLNMSCSRYVEIETMLEDFLDSAERLWNTLKRLVKNCGRYVSKRFKEDGTEKMGKESGREFVEALFGRDRLLENTENLVRKMKLWIMRFDANCDGILSGAESPVKK